MDAEEFWPVYEKAQELGVPIIVHPVNTGPIIGGNALRLFGADA